MTCDSILSAMQEVGTFLLPFVAWAGVIIIITAVITFGGFLGLMWAIVLWEEGKLNRFIPKRFHEEPSTTEL